MPAGFTVKPVYVEGGSTRLGKWVLRRFQEKILDYVGSRRDTLLVAPTGSGKTLSLLLGEYGFVGVYPNNTLLLDQQRSIHKILTEALGARLIHSDGERGVHILRIYEVPSDAGGEPSITEYRRIAVAVLSGRYIGYEYDENGGLTPKRVTILRRIVDKICYPSKGESMPYIINLATPDTALMIMAGIYRDFKKVGYALHDLLLASVEGVTNIDYLLSKHKTATVSELGDLSSIRQCLLKYPWFIDEFHLYGTHEAYSLLPVLKVYRDYAGWDEPFVLSSATPKGTIYEVMLSKYKVSEIAETGREKGDKETLVRGETRVEVVPKYVEGRGVSKWFRIGFTIPEVVSGKIDEIRNVITNGGRVFIVVDRVNQVPGIVEELLSNKIRPECSVSITPPGCSEDEELVLVGSESISQGIDRSNVRYGILTAYNWASLLQRFGRIGRKVDSKVVIVVPLLKNHVPLESLDGKSISYREFGEIVARDFPNIDLTRMYKTESYKNAMKDRSKLLEYASTIAYAQVSKPKQTLEKLARMASEDAERLLEMFYGPPDIIAKILMFRSTGFPVLVEKPGGEPEYTDIATVLRNYSVKQATTEWINLKGVRKSMVKLRISLEPDRLKLVMRIDLDRRKAVREDIASLLAGKITTIGELIDLGYRLFIESWDDVKFELEVPVTPDVREQTLLLLKLPEELVSAYAYSIAGIEIIVGERSIIGLLI